MTDSTQPPYPEREYPGSDPTFEPTHEYPPTVDDLTVVHPLGARATGPQAVPSAVTSEDPAGRAAYADIGSSRPRRWGPSVPTVLAGALLVAVGLVVAILRLTDSTDGPTAAVIVLAFGAVLIVSGALALLAGRQRRQHP